MDSRFFFLFSTPNCLVFFQPHDRNGYFMLQRRANCSPETLESIDYISTILHRKNNIVSNYYDIRLKL